ncbi:glycosyltransferase [candidate division KSB1 bacterium]|nr:glycosyltransferase [candidate division KSB1 bacterium]
MKRDNTIPQISIVIPLYNEAESLVELHTQIVNVMQSINATYEIIFIDDGSNDSSFDVLKQLYETSRQIRIFQFRKNFGKSAALATGFAKASGEFVITMDADLQDDPHEIPALIDKLNEGYDLVSGWKKKRYDPFIKKYTSKVFNRTTSWVSGLYIHDFNCGLKAYRREVVKNVQVYGQLHRYIPMLAHLQGFRVTEIPVQHHPRKYGMTKFGISRFTAGLFDLITTAFLARFKRRPLHLFGTMGLISFTIGALICLYLAYYWMFIESRLTNRPILFLGILLIMVGVQFFSIGLLGELITDSKKKDLEYSIKTSLE